MQVTSGAPWPFGVVWVRDVDSEDSVTLWTDAYEENRHVGTDGKHVEGVDDIGPVRNLEGGESISRTFELHDDTPHLGTGTYEGELDVGVAPSEGDESERLAVELAITVEEADDGDAAEGTVVEDPRVDDSPYPIERPEPPGTPTTARSGTTTTSANTWPPSPRSRSRPSPAWDSRIAP